MTADNENKQQERLLNEILDTVQAIDESVDEILDCLADFLEESRYGSSHIEPDFLDEESF